ncbi:6-bladed beta-propeller [Geofilum rubicundum]|nr:6-bladed beta-propeller [Geofilum rubicundum]
MKKAILFSLVFLCCFACRNRNKVDEFRPRGASENLVHIDLDLKNLTYVDPDTVIKDIEFIPLESSENCLIGSYDKILLINDTIYILDRHQQKAVFAFNREGEFLFKISAEGRGPGEYTEATDFYVDTVDSHIGILDFGRVQKYDFNGRYIGQVKFSGHGPSEISYNAGRFNGVSLERFARKQSKVFFQYDSEGKVIYSDHPSSNSLLKFEMQESKYFSSNKAENYFNYFGSDTIYLITDSFLQPAFVLDYGKSALLPHIREQLFSKPLDDTWSFFRDNQDIVMYGLTSMSISDDFLLLNVPYGMTLKNVLYSLKTQEIKILRSSPPHWSTLYPQDIQLTDNGAIGIIASDDVDRVKMIKDDNPSDLETNNPFFYQKIKGFENITDTDNSIICLFTFRDF